MSLAQTCDFHPSGCGHCKKMKPEYDEAAEILNKDADVSLLSCSPARLRLARFRAVQLAVHPHRWTTPRGAQ